MRNLNQITIIIVIYSALRLEDYFLMELICSIEKMIVIESHNNNDHHCLKIGCKCRYVPPFYRQRMDIKFYLLNCYNIRGGTLLKAFR